MNRPGIGRISVDVTAELASQIGDGSEDAPSDDFALNFGEPQLDLIQPGGVGGSEVKPDAGILLQEFSYPRGLVSGEVVEDDVDLLTGRTQCDNFLQEGNKVLTGMASGGLAVNPASDRVQRRIEGERPMTVVFEAVALGATGRSGSTGSSRSSA